MILKVGSRGDAVRRWQRFLIIKGYAPGAVDGVFGYRTRMATAQYQQKNRLSADGVVGPQTMRSAMWQGFPVGMKPDQVLMGAGDEGYPELPGFTSPAQAQRYAMFGDFEYTVNTDYSINILGSWVRENITQVTIPQLCGVENPYSRRAFSGGVYFHRHAVPQLRAFFDALQREGLHRLVLTWGGSFVPRMVRGSATRLSNHAFGSAFDINMQWNGLGATPKLAGERGSVRQLVSLANEHGFFWGGHYRSRKDGMHFEVAMLL